MVFLIASSLGFLCGASVSAADSDRQLHQEIDELLAGSSRGATIRRADDAQFLRRVTLDLTGQIPSASDVREFTVSDAVDKRATEIDRLLARVEYTRHWQQVLDSWLMQRRPRRHVSDEEWQAYLRDSLSQNKPWNQLTLEILGADGSDIATRPIARFYLDRECSTEELVRDISSIFLGRDVRCAQCHDHPIIPDYLQAHYFGIAAFVDRSFLFEEKEQKRKVLAEKSEGVTAFTSALTQVRGVAEPRIFDGPQFLDPNQTGSVAAVDGVRPVPTFSRRARLPLAVVSHPAFARTTVNRLWATLFGRGIVDPIDQDHDGNPPAHPELLRLLSVRFVEMNYDIRAMLRQLTLTEIYGSSELPMLSETNSPKLSVTLRKLTPEQLAWSWLRATGRIDAERTLLMSELRSNDPKMIDILTVSKSMEEAILHDRLAQEADQVAKVFVTSLPGESTRSDATAEQALFLMNGEILRGWIARREGNLVDRLMKQDDQQVMIQDLFLSLLSRLPDDDEIAWTQKTLTDATTAREIVLSDLVESLLTSTEFRFNH